MKLPLEDGIYCKNEQTQNAFFEKFGVIKNTTGNLWQALKGIPVFQSTIVPEGEVWYVKNGEVKIKGIL